MVQVLVIGMFAALALMGTAMADITRTGLVAEYHFDGDAKDSSGNGNDGVIYGATFVDGKLGKALALNGIDEYVKIPNAASLNPIQITVEAWIKAKPKNDYILVIDKSHGATDSTGWVMQIWTNGSITFVYCGSSGVGGGCVSPGIGVFSTSIVTDDVWHHVVGTFDGTNTKIYIDGVLQNSVPYIGTPQINNRDVHIGMWWGGGTAARFFNGLIEEVRIYNRALSADEVSANYQAGRIVITSSPSGAAVLINGQSKGVASPNLTVYGVSPSSYSITCNLSGYSDYNTNVVLTAGSVANVNCALQLAPTTPPTTAAPSTPPTTAPTTPTEVLVPGPSASPLSSTQPSTALTPTLTPTPAPASITGRITDARTGDPVQGATVSIDGVSSISDVNGNYDQTVQVGKHNLSVSMQGYETMTRPITVPEGGTMLDIPLKPVSGNESWLWIVIILLIVIVAVVAVIIYLLYKKKNKKAEEKKKETVEMQKFCMYCHAPLAPDAKFCPACGKKQVEKTRFCMNCGAPMPNAPDLCPKCSKMPPSDVDTKTCKNCGEVIPAVAKFCSACGAGQPE